MDRIDTLLMALETRITLLEREAAAKKNEDYQKEVTTTYIQETPLRLFRSFLLTLYAHDPELPVRRFLELARSQELEVLDRANLPQTIVEPIQLRIEELMLLALPKDK
ncbi:hypothetical protein [Roseibium aggregatum]|uniref:hypothetical protein n=1 Tax=Roseibium aggregatum TaxID=187304 RepID=UPI0025ACFCC7|nr:hypothetical protein [Roseibium aggregatum]WJS05765.1 hypothetical protein QUB73_27450 [Roseibium aggregatum]